LLLGGGYFDTIPDQLEIKSLNISEIGVFYLLNRFMYNGFFKN